MHQGLYAPGIAMLEPETNIMLNAVFQPIFEMYDLDFVFTGHTHMQGRSNFISDGVVVGKAESGKTYTDPNGIIYLNTNAFCDQGSMDNMYLWPYTAYGFEGTQKIGQRIEAGAAGNFRYRNFAFHKQLLCVLDAQMGNIPLKGCSRDCLEYFGKMIGGNTQCRGYLI
jgi:hypothetical protein